MDIGLLLKEVDRKMPDADSPSWERFYPSSRPESSGIPQRPIHGFDGLETVNRNHAEPQTSTQPNRRDSAIMQSEPSMMAIHSFVKTKTVNYLAV